MTLHFGEKLRLLRQERRLSQTDLARQLGLSSHAVLSNLEAGRKQPSLDLAVALAAALGTTTDYLLRDTIPPAPPHLLAPLAASHRPLSERALGARLRELRLATGMTQTALASHLGLSANVHVSYLEAGKKEPSIELVVRLADLFGLSVDDLLQSGEGSPSSGEADA